MSTAYPAALDTVQSLIQAVNNWSYQLTAAINNVQTVIPVTTVVGLPTPGLISIGSEVIAYTGVVNSGATQQLTGCTRGYDNTTAGSYATGTRVEVRWVAFHHNHLASAIAAIEAELGLGPKGAYDDVKERLDLNLPETVQFSPATTNWSFTHTRGRIVMVQLYRKVLGTTYELFEANIEQVVDPSGVSQVNITLSASEEGYAIYL